MAPRRLENYLRAHRKRSGLTQRKVAFLLGCETSAPVSRYEKRKQLPSLETALACEAIFGVPVADLFAGVRERVARDVERRRTALTRITQDEHEGDVASVANEPSSRA